MTHQNCQEINPPRTSLIVIRNNKVNRLFCWRQAVWHAYTCLPTIDKAGLSFCKNARGLRNYYLLTCKSCNRTFCLTIRQKVNV